MLAAILLSQPRQSRHRTPSRSSGNSRAVGTAHSNGREREPITDPETQGQARKAAPGSEIIDFDYVDATNLASADAPHVIGLQVHFVDANHVVLTFRFHAVKGESFERVTLARVKDKPA